MAAKTNQPMECPDCGGTFFSIFRAEEFANMGGANTQLRSLSMNQEPVHVCICGRPVEIKDTTAVTKSDGQRARFLRSLTAALAHRKQNSVQLAATVVTDLSSANEKIAELEAKVDWLTTAVETLVEAASEETDEDEAAEAELGSIAVEASQKEVQEPTLAETKPEPAKTEDAPALRAKNLKPGKKEK
jgi:hypothetical protein